MKQKRSLRWKWRLTWSQIAVGVIVLVSWVIIRICCRFCWIRKRKDNKVKKCVNGSVNDFLGYFGVHHQLQQLKRCVNFPMHSPSRVLPSPTGNEWRACLHLLLVNIVPRFGVARLIIRQSWCLASILRRGWADWRCWSTWLALFLFWLGIWNLNNIIFL